MSLLTFVLLSTAAFALMQFRVVPALARRYVVDRTPTSIGRIATLTVAEFLRTVAMIAAVTSAACTTIVLLLQVTFGSSADGLAAAAARIEAFRGFLLFFSPLWSAFAVVLLVIALAIYSQRRAKRELTRVFQSIFEREFQRLQRLAEDGKLEYLPQTAEMKELEAKIGEGRKVYQEIDSVDAPPSQKEAVKAKLTEQVSQLIMFYHALDIGRRVSPTIDPELAKLPEPETRWERFLALFISRGLLKSLNGMTRAIYVCTLAFLVPSFIGLVAVPSGAALQRRNVTIRDLIITSGRAEWKQTRDSLGQPKQQLDAREQQLVKQIARNYETRLASQQVWPKVKLSSSFELRSHLIRSQILTDARKRSATEWTQYASGSSVEALSPLQHEVVRIPEQSLAVDAPLGVEGQRIYEELTDVARRSPSVRERLHAWAEPASVSDISRSLVNHVGSVLAGDVHGPIGDLLAGVEFQGLREDFNRFHETARHEFLSDIVAKANPKETYDRVGRTRASHAVPADFADIQTVMRSATEKIKLDDATAHLRTSPAGVEVKEKNVDWKAAAGDLIDIRSVPGFRRGGEALTECLTTYRDLFPGQPDTDKTTVAHKLIAVLGDKPIDPDDFSPSGGTTPEPTPRPGGGGSLSEATKIIEAAAKEPDFIAGHGDAKSAAFVRARNFRELGTFAKVGGVLIGWSPESSSWTVPISDLRWQTEGNKIRFILVDGGGREHRSGLYRAEIAYQALSYAADGRATAVTIMRASPLFDYKVYLHPTLVDTPLGQRIIRLDKFVNEYTYTKFAENDADLQRMKQAHDDVSNENALFQFAWSQRILGFVPELIARARRANRMDDDEKRKFITALQAYQTVASKIAAEPDIRAAADTAWRRRTTIFGTNHSSPMRESGDFYDPSLVNVLQESVDEAASLDALGEHIRGTQKTPESDDALRRWLAFPPEYTALTGVRETPFDPDPAALIIPDGKPFVPPFRFMTQISFTSRPLSENTNGMEKAWEYKAFQPLIQQRVMTAVAGDPTARTVMADAAEFTMLQRLFRMAFEGRLGESFPIEKLTLLANALASFAPKLSHTARWDTRSDEIQFVRAAAKKNRTLQGIIDRLPKLRRDLGIPSDEAARGKGELTPIN